ncbi:DnaJ domain-containing protein [Telmatospirillum sp. J64-1]|uniref:DnaJ domain-containing protein n=1 Tax=Telmatospirillum sp. J64-1 TaxID=2502183 RepID=UPI00115F6A48|nr:DnaJ domain-containing protein [Telmatospirillum sp. J64-1]
MSGFYDPKGYYAVLGLTPKARPEEIQAAYRRRAKELHPDRRDGGDAEAFTRLGEAYTVLRDPKSRAQYDALSPSTKPPPADGLSCRCCGKISAQPRYVIFQKVRSFLLFSRREKIAGIFCRDCADRTALQVSAMTWAWGWWSPVGPFLSLWALLDSLGGGEKPRRENAVLLLRLARHFQARGEIHLARSAALQARTFARGEQAREAEALLAALPDTGPRLKDRWHRPGLTMWLLALPLVAMVGLWSYGISLWLVPLFSPSPQPDAALAARSDIVPPRPGEIRHVQATELKLRQLPVDHAAMVALLDRFTTVQVIDRTSDPEWVQLRSASGAVGYARTRHLGEGDGWRPRRRWCAENRGQPPFNGQILLRRGSGDHRLQIANPMPHDAVVKLRTQAGHTILSAYVAAGRTVLLTGIPEGAHRIAFATGEVFSEACSLFLTDMRAYALPGLLVFQAGRTDTRSSVMLSLTLTPPGEGPGQPRPYDPARFAEDG